MRQKLTVLFAPSDGVGHVNACVGIGEVLRDRGHRIVFVVCDIWKNMLKKYGFEEEICRSNESESDVDPGTYWAELFEKGGMFGSKPPMEKMKNFNKLTANGLIKQIQDSDKKVKEIVERVKPDIIVIDGFVWMPSLMNSGIPWVWSISTNLLSIDHAFDYEDIPPGGLGLPADSDKKIWRKVRDEKNEALIPTIENFNNWLISNGFPTLPTQKLITPSPYLNIYMVPKELDYTDIMKFPENWHRFDYFMRSEAQENFVIPEKLRNRSGKLIYLSMGSMGGTDVNLMKRLVQILSKSQHRIIVSKGPLHDQFELSDNMWGQQTLPQIKVLKVVDLVITHGGNNTFTETFFFGKPMIVLPIFCDQFDNAQRLQEKNLGVRLDPYTCTQEELLSSIDRLLDDKILNKKLLKISKRIQKSKSISRVSELIEGLASK